MYLSLMRGRQLTDEGEALFLERKNSAEEMGHRIAKHVNSSNNVWEKSQFRLTKTRQQQALVRQLLGTTYYVLDAQGKNADEPVSMKTESLSGKTVSSKEMSVYEYANDDQTQTLTFAQTEKHIYGSSRLGVNNEKIPMLGTQNKTYSMRSVLHHIGERSYELQNHLGNVLSVISDKVIPHNNGGNIDYFLADIRQSTDYSPFGVTLHGRNFTASGAEKFRYGFNGIEGDDEIKGEGNSYSTEFRQYDPRIGRWLTIDALASSFAGMTPYNAFNNNPVYFIDKYGLNGTPGDSGPKTHSLKKGETLSHLAVKYGVSLDDLKKWNPGTKDRLTKLKIGENIIVSDPGGNVMPTNENISMPEGDLKIQQVGTDNDPEMPVGLLEFEFKPANTVEGGTEIVIVQTMRTNSHRNSEYIPYPTPPDATVDVYDYDSRNSQSTMFYKDANGTIHFNDMFNRQLVKGESQFLNFETSVLQMTNDGQITRVVTFNWLFVISPQGTTSVVGPIQFHEPSEFHDRMIRNGPEYSYWFNKKQNNGNAQYYEYVLQ